VPTAAKNTFSAQALHPCYRGNDALLIRVRLPASVTYAKGTVLGEITASPGTFKAYASGNVDGSQVAKAILALDCATDGSQNVSFGAAVGGSPWGETEPSAPAYISGYFRSTELVGLDANALTNALGRLQSGTVADGIICVTGGG
jgi:hypothetical protein